MTALIFVLSPEIVYLGMDTLAVHSEDKLPHKFMSKALLLPHLSAVVCGTGVVQLVLDWYVDIQANILARDMDYVNGIAPERLSTIWRRLGEPGTSTVYHFGYSRDEAAFTGFTFRSTNKFAQEKLAYGLGVKPPFEELILVAQDRIAKLGIQEALSSLVGDARSLDDKLHVKDMVGIGGEVHLLTITASGQFGWVVRPWPDYDAIFDEMLQRLREDNERPG